MIDDLNEEHESLHMMVDSVLFFIQNVNGNVVGRDAIDIILKRVKEHFTLEEQVASARGAQDVAVLKKEHDRLLDELTEIRNSRELHDFAELKRRLAEFAKDLEFHNRHVDDPFFKRL